MKTKITYLLTMIIAATLFFSCSKDDNDPSYLFIDQILQGEIEGDAWTNISGTATINYFDSTQMDIDLFEITVEDPCNDYNISGNKVIFSIPDEEGLYLLNLDLNGDPQTVTLYHEATTMNNVAIIGAIEITLIDKVNGIVEGRIDAHVNDNNFVNGNFSVVFCEDSW